MSWDVLAAHPAAAWLAAALVLGIGEIVVPGVFLIFLAIAAAITGAALLAINLPAAAQLASFAVWSAVAVGIGRRWYVDYPLATDDPLLNDRAARLLGQSVVVTEPLVGGRGRVRVGDGEWPATGPDAPAGAAMRVTGADGLVLEVAPVSASATR